MIDVDDLMARMSLEQKCAQLGGAWFSELVTDGVPDPERMSGVLAHGIGQITRISAETGLGPDRTPELANRIQRYLVEDTALGIPAIIHEEAVGGLCARGATQFPHGVSLAATWDPDLIEAVSTVIGRQMRAVGARLALSPVLDIARDARWGRVEETYGEDPELSSRMAVAYVRGLQSRGVDATLKHFVAYGAPDAGFNWGSVSVGPRHLRDVLAAPFRAAINEAHAGAVMASYNEIDGLPVHGSRELLTELLRDELGFDGVVVADYFGVSCLVAFHHCAAEPAEAARLALGAGLDVELPSHDAFRTLPDQVRAGTLPMDAVDVGCRRVLDQKSRLGLFEDPYVDVDAAPAIFDTPEDRALARSAAAESIVLLTNDGTLPLRTDQRVAVVGPSRDDPRLMLGDYHFPAHVEIMVSHATAEELPAHNRLRAVPPQNPTPTPLTALRSRVDVVDTVVGADVAVVFVGGRSGLLPDDSSGEGRDASDLRIAAEQLAVIEDAATAGVPVVVVVIGGRVHSLSEVVPHANAVLLAWLPGEEGGNAIADVLCGDVDPSGRLPVTILRSVGQVGVQSGAHRGGGLSMFHGDYTDAPSIPLFPFGHGCSYTTWELSGLSVHAGTTAEDVRVEVTVTNAGTRAGVNVVQVFFRDDVASVGLPTSRLLAFRRVELDGSASARVEFGVPAGRLGFTGRDLRYRVEPGDFTFMVGELSETITISGDVEYPERNALAPFTCRTEEVTARVV